MSDDLEEITLKARILTAAALCDAQRHPETAKVLTDALEEIERLQRTLQVTAESSASVAASLSVFTPMLRRLENPSQAMFEIMCLRDVPLAMCRSPERGNWQLSERIQPDSPMFRVLQEFDEEEDARRAFMYASFVWRWNKALEAAYNDPIPNPPTAG